MVLESAVWRVAPTSTPRVHRRCPGCGRDRPFVSSDRFRLNASKRRIDAWLIYRCSVCEATWNLTLLTRVSQSAIDPDLFERMTRNDPTTAMAFAFDKGCLARAGARVDPAVSFRVEHSEVRLRPAVGLCVRLVLSLPCAIPVHVLLGQELGLSRSRLERHAARGDIATAPRRSLRQPIADDMVIELRAPVFERGASEPALQGEAVDEPCHGSDRDRART
jgi:hypothetical protein